MPALDCGLNNTMIPSISIIPMNFEFGKMTFCMTTVFTLNLHKSMVLKNKKIGNVLSFKKIFIVCLGGLNRVTVRCSKAH